MALLMEKREWTREEANLRRQAAIAEKQCKDLEASKLDPLVSCRMWTMIVVILMFQSQEVGALQEFELRLDMDRSTYVKRLFRQLRSVKVTLLLLLFSLSLF